jgi:hypothetical protein
MDSKQFCPNQISSGTWSTVVLINAETSLIALTTKTF